MTETESPETTPRETIPPETAATGAEPSGSAPAVSPAPSASGDGEAGGADAPERLVLSAEARRVVGVLMEKSLATPEYYPMTRKALVVACNQKNNREPVTHYTDADVQEALDTLQALRLVLAVKQPGSRAIKWRHEMQRVYNLQFREAAVLTELLLRGPQAEGELRARASRMRPVEDLDALHYTLGLLSNRRPSFAFRLSPPGQVRGVRHAHLLYTDEELEALRSGAFEPPEASAPGPAGASGALGAASAGSAGAGAELRERLTKVEARLARLEAALGVSADEGDDVGPDDEGFGSGASA